MSKTALIILDGWGHGTKSASNAIFNAKTPNITDKGIIKPIKMLK